MAREEDDGVSLGAAVVLASTEKAIKVKLEEGDEVAWFPKSIIHDNSEVWKDGDDGELILQTWWAEKNGRA